MTDERKPNKLLGLVRSRRAQVEASASAPPPSLSLSLADWCCQCLPDVTSNSAYNTPAPHHLLLIDRLERVACGEISRLAIFMPPGSAKSTYGSILFPLWFLAATPGASIIAASHTTELAEQWGRRVRNLLGDHGAALNIALSTDSKAAGKWELTNGGRYLAAGVGKGIAGFRADLAVIDDPVRSREDADSALIRDGIWEWYKSDLLTRLKPGGRIVLIQTRWHEEDLAGRLLAEMACGGERWEVISLPAEAEENDPLGRKSGEFLWSDDPAYNYAEGLRKQKAIQPSRNWSALFQQRPAPESGDFFKAEWFKPYEEAPARAQLSVYGASDYAVTSNGGDYTVHLVVGLDQYDNLYLLDLWRGRTTPDIWIERWCDLVSKWKPKGWAEEKGQISAAVGPLRDKIRQERRISCHVRQFPSRHDKATRAQSIRGRMAERGLHVPAHAQWLSALRSELLAFPAGAHDDQVDALGLIGQVLDRMRAGPAPEEQSDDTPIGLHGMTWDQLWGEQEAYNRRRRAEIPRI